MSLYTRVHTPNSPLLPLSPMPSSSTFLSRYIASLGSRRSFTPNHLNILPPPIRGGKSSIKRKSCDLHDDPKSSESKFKRPLPVPAPVQSSAQKSMKKVRSSARKVEVRSSHARIPLDSIRRSLFVADSPPIDQVQMSPNVSRINYAHLKTPQQKYSMYATPQRYTQTHLSVDSAATAAAGIQYDHYTPSFPSPCMNASHNATPGLLEETFTVMSILKEINMQKYASLFAREEVDLFVFLMLTYEDMFELGIEEGDRPILIFTEFFGNPENNNFL